MEGTIVGWKKLPTQQFGELSLDTITKCKNKKQNKHTYIFILLFLNAQVLTNSSLFNFFLPNLSLLILLYNVIYLCLVCTTSENSPPLKCEKLCFCCFSWTKPHFLMDIWIWAPPSNQFWKKKPHLCFELLKWIRHIFLSRYREKIVLKWSSTCEKMTEIIWFQNILKNSKLSAHILILCMLFRFHLS